jgi:hypothetical protein
MVRRNRGCACRNASLALTGIFSRTISVDELTTSGNASLDIVPTVKVRCFLNQKVWINSEVRGKLKDRITAHRANASNPRATAEDTNMYKKSDYDLRRAVKQEKRQYLNKVETFYTGA